MTDPGTNQFATGSDYQFSIRAKLFILVLSVVLLMLGLFIYHIYDEFDQSMAAATGKLDIISEHTAADISRLLREQEQMLARLAQQPQIRSLEAMSCHPIMSDYAQLRDLYTSITVRDIQGNAICSTNPNPPDAEKMLSYSWFQKAILNDKYGVNDVLRGSTSKRWVVPLTYPIHNQAGALVGVLILGVDLLKLNSLLFELIHASAEEIVIDKDNTFLLSSIQPESRIGQSLSEGQILASQDLSSGYFIMNDPEGIRSLFAVRTVPGTDWKVLAGLPEKALFSEYYKRRTEVIVSVLTILLLVLALAWRLSSNIAIPIREFARTAKRIADGHVAERVKIVGPTEIETLAYHFNHMLDALEQQREERAALVGHLEKLFRQARDIILLVGPSGNLVEVNDAAIKAYGYEKDELLGMKIGDLHEQNAPADKQIDWQLLLENEGALFETIHRSKDGHTFPVEVSSRIIDIDGKAYLQSFIRDITERHEAELQISRLNWAYVTLSQTNEAIVRMRDASELFPRICDIAVEHGGYVGAWIGLVDEATGLVNPVAFAGNIGDYIRSIEVSTNPAMVEGRGPSAQAVREGHPYFCQDFAADPLAEHWSDLAASYGIRSMVALPLKRNSLIVGVLVMYAADINVFDVSMRHLLEEMAADVSYALDNFEREAARSRAEQALVESEARYRSIIETSHDAFILVGAKGSVLDVNNATTILSGYSHDELIGMSLRDLEAIETDEELAGTVAEVAADGYGRFERTWRNKAGELIEVEISTTFMGEELGGYFFAFIHDIKERKLVEQAMRQGEERFRSILEQNISAMFVIENGIITYANRRAGQILGYDVEELIGLQMLDLLVDNKDKCTIAGEIEKLVSGVEKSIDGNFTVRRKDGTLADIGANAVLATLQGKSVVLGMAQDIGERKKAQLEIAHHIQRLENAMESTLSAVSLMVELRDPYTAGHEQRVGELAAAIGEELGLPENRVKGLRLAGYVHDIGKISIPAEILSKPSKLTPNEFELIKGHSQSGYDVLRAVDFPWPIAQIILQHHERLDGSGYPRQLRDEEIILEARIMAVADVVEAMSSHRPYRPGLGVDAALEEITMNSGKFYDHKVVDACVRLYREKAFDQSE